MAQQKHIMNLQQLLEGQQQQIEMLRPSSIVDLYYPASLRDAIDMVSGKFEGSDPLLVTMKLKYAVRWSDVVVEFWTTGKHIQPPRRIRKSERDQKIAARKYPESFNPLVTHSLLSKKSLAILDKHPMPSHLESIYVNINNEITKMSPSEFLEWYIKLVRQHEGNRHAIESKMNERYNSNAANLMIGA